MEENASKKESVVRGPFHRNAHPLHTYAGHGKRDAETRDVNQSQNQGQSPSQRKLTSQEKYPKHGLPNVSTSLNSQEKNDATQASSRKQARSHNENTETMATKTQRCREESPSNCKVLASTMESQKRTMTTVLVSTEHSGYATTPTTATTNTGHSKSHEATKGPRTPTDSSWEKPISPHGVQDSACNQRVYQPRPSRSMPPAAWEEALKPDDDIWVERSYRTRRGKRMLYYSSLVSGEYRLLEPPTGASLIVHRCDTESEQLPPELEAFREKQVPIETLRSLRCPRPSLDLQQKIQKRPLLFRLRRRRFWRSKKKETTCCVQGGPKQTVASRADCEK